jgi:hypothetical protein
MRALHALTTRLTATARVDAARELSVEVSRESGRTGVFTTDREGRYLSQSEVVAILPFQVSSRRFALGAYVMTQDFPADLAPQAYDITILGVHALHAQVNLFLPETSEVRPVRVVARASDRMTVAVPLTDVPRLIEIEETEAS